MDKTVITTKFSVLTVTYIHHTALNLYKKKSRSGQATNLLPHKQKYTWASRAIVTAINMQMMKLQIGYKIRLKSW